ncbi:YHYH protein [Aquirufa sp. ROCK2-A2]
MKKIFLILLLLPLLMKGHSPQISTLAIVKDKGDLWTLHISASLSAFQYALGNSKATTEIEFQRELIESLKMSIQIKYGLLNMVKLTDGQCHLGHQTDVKFTLLNMPKNLDELSIENHFFSKLYNHYTVLKVMDEPLESNQFILTAANHFAAKVEESNGQILIDSTSEFNFYYLFLTLPFMLLLIRKSPLMKTFSAILVTFFLFSCSKEETTVTPTNDTAIPEVYKKIYGAVSMTSDGTYLTIKSRALPDHKSPYYASTNSLYQSFSGTTFGGITFAKNPNSIVEQSGTFKIPLSPKVASNHAATPLGPIGIALNGVPFFNQYAGPNNQELKGEMASFDQYYGHPQQSGVYHYHVEPVYLTTVKSSKSGLMGFLLDGFPVYGPTEENGSAVTNDKLDVYHGHTHATLDYPAGIYHYHFTQEAPYLNGSGFYGTPGTISQ